jgi:hypothetical protein
MTGTTHIIERRSALSTHRCQYCGAEYSIWLSIGSSKNHCSRWRCHLEHAKVVREKDNQRRRGKL